MSNRIRIRRYEPSDIDAVFEAIMESKTDLTRWMPWCHAEYSRQETADWVMRRPEAWERNEEKSFLIVDANEQILGSCGIHRIDVRNGVGEIGYWVRSSATCCGVATEATRQICRWAFEEADFHRLEILASVENSASQRVAEKSGGIREGVLRNRFLLHGRRHDCALFSILKE